MIVSGTAAFHPRKPGHRAAGRRGLLTALVVCAIFLAAGPPFAVAAETAVVKVKRLNLRAEPTQDAKTLAVLEKGMRLPVMQRLEGWVRVRYGERSGYLRHRDRYLTLVPESPSAKKTAADMEKIRREAETLQRRIEASKAEVVTYTHQEKETIDSLDDLDRTLNRTRAQVSATRREMAALDEAISEADAAVAAKDEKRRALDAYATRRLVALYKLNWLGRINILASAESMGELFHRERALGRVLDHDNRVLEELSRSRRELAALRDRQSERRKEKAALQVRLQSQIETLTQDRGNRERVLDEIRSRKSLELAAIDSFKQAATELDQKIQELGRRLAKAAAAPPAPPASAAGKEGPDVPTDTDVAFLSLKGLLNLPVNGKIVSFFGPYRNPAFKVMNFRSGVDIRADMGEPVRAVHNGRILYSSWFKGYGNMLIVDHGENYYTVYAHVEEMFKAKGDRVEAGEVIATVGDTGSLAGPKLHFEIRYHGKPLDPMKWIKKG